MSKAEVGAVVSIEAHGKKGAKGVAEVKGVARSGKKQEKKGK